MNTSLGFSKYKLSQRPLFYENFITALSTYPVLEFMLKRLDDMPLDLTWKWAPIAGTL